MIARTSAPSKAILFCLNLADGSTVWKARIGADSDSTPAVYEGMVYTAAENGYVYCFRQIDGDSFGSTRRSRWNGKREADSGRARSSRMESAHRLEQRLSVLL